MAEFNNILTELKNVLSNRRQEAGLHHYEQYILCLDHATAHSQAAQILGHGWQLLPHPAHSPDCNKPIEHVHGQLDAKMKSWLVELRQQQPNAHPTPQQCKDQLRAFFNSLTPASINADVATLPATWQAIVNNDGGYVAGKLS